MAGAQLKGRVDWAGGLRFIGSTERGQSFVMEGSAAEGAVRIGASPMEVLLIGMGGCSSFDVVSILKKMRQPVEDVVCDLTAERADAVPAVFVKAHMSFTVTGDVAQAKAEEAVRLSVEKYCSASKMIAETAEITWDVRIEAGEG